MWPLIETAGTALALMLALALRPWRLLRGPLLTPALGALVLLPLLWLTPQLMPAGLRIQLSGASLLVLMLGWPLAVPVLAAVAALVWLLGSGGALDAVGRLWWLGVVPATLALGIGAVLRRWLPPNPFVYTLGRGFIGTALAGFAAGPLMQWAHPVAADQALVAAWLMAWGDAFLTGLLVAVFVAFVPQWLATWSDARYLLTPDRE
ncbi:MAG: hypothetical protein IBJ04_07265 [Hydrogenophaga sp.]|uniref:hypothetical protein n=1 Tax=Hydrogenophaga sp. TaxID=1904254 RepID=UPI0025805B67|nr:hypothetical protein [Hydrogenophaga sp.]MBL0944107.1 hypothetical protein [Hydrogenophaga sp.]